MGRGGVKGNQAASPRFDLIAFAEWGITKISGRFQHLLDEINANLNVDYGPEFEIALCIALRSVLPNRFGICRGWIVPATGDPVGDDLIIFDRERFSTLRMIGQDNFARKEEIPFEAVCAYLEAKHTLHLEGEGRQSLDKASAQINAVKVLVRESRPHGKIDPYMEPLPVEETAPWWPEGRNPLFTGIFARHVALEKGKPHLTMSEIQQALRNRKSKFRLSETMRKNSMDEWRESKMKADQLLPDLLVLGSDNVMLPYVGWKDGSLAYITPFNIPEATMMWHTCVEKLAFGIGVSSLLLALDMIQLGRMPWQKMIHDALVVNAPDRMTKLADLFP